MTQEEQIQQQADNYIGHPEDLGEDINITNERKAFIAGAKWAIETFLKPTIEKLEIEYFERFKEGRQEDKEKLIAEGCRWLEKYVENAFVSVKGRMIELAGIELSEDFRKTMEELK